MDTGKSLLVVFLLLCVGLIIVPTHMDALVLYLVLSTLALVFSAVMAATEPRGLRLVPFLHHASRGVSLIWAAFWWLFRTAALRGELLTSGEWFARPLLPIVFSASAALVWTSDDWGGAVLTLEGLALQVLFLARYPQFLRAPEVGLPVVLGATVLLAVPAELAGLLGLAAWRRARQSAG